MKKIFFAFLLVVLAGNVFAVPATATISSPAEGQAFTVGDTIELNVSSNVKINAVWISGLFNGHFTPLGYVSFSDENKTSYNTVIDSAGFPAGPAQIKVDIGYYANPNDPLSYTMLTDNVNFVLTENPEANTGPVTVIRSAPGEVYAGSYVMINLVVNPASQFPGIILNETIPEQSTYINFFESPFFDGQIEDVKQGNTIKYVVMEKDGIPFMAIEYQVYVNNELEPGDEIPLSGTWVIEGTQGTIIGTSSLKIGGFKIPNCPLTDQQLLEFIGKWANEEINNNQILQVIEGWKTCLNAPV